MNAASGLERRFCREPQESMQDNRMRPCAISAYFLQMAHRKSDDGAHPAHKFSGKNLFGSEFILHKNVGIHLPSTA